MVETAQEKGPLFFIIQASWMMKHICEVERIKHFTDFELLDQSFIEVLRQIDDLMPYLRGIVSELGFGMERIYYTQNKCDHGKSYANFLKLYDFAMLGIRYFGVSDSARWCREGMDMQ